VLPSYFIIASNLPNYLLRPSTIYPTIIHLTYLDSMLMIDINISSNEIMFCFKLFEVFFVCDYVCIWLVSSSRSTCRCSARGQRRRSTPLSMTPTMSMVYPLSCWGYAGKHLKFEEPTSDGKFIATDRHTSEWFNTTVKLFRCVTEAVMETLSC
jgi:hypothetical protein